MAVRAYRTKWPASSNPRTLDLRQQGERSHCQSKLHRSGAPGHMALQGAALIKSDCIITLSLSITQR